MNILRINFLRYLSAFAHVKREINEQKKFNQSFLLPYMKSLEKKFNGTFPEAQVKKSSIIMAYLSAAFYAAVTKGYIQKS